MKGWTCVWPAVLWREHQLGEKSYKHIIIISWYVRDAINFSLQEDSVNKTDCRLVISSGIIGPAGRLACRLKDGCWIDFMYHENKFTFLRKNLIFLFPRPPYGVTEIVLSQDEFSCFDLVKWNVPMVFCWGELSI